MKVKSLKRKWKRSLIFSQRGKLVETELTFDKFLEGLEGEMEYFFVYGDTTIDIAFHYEQQKKIFELNIDGYCDNAQRYCFTTIDALTHAKLVAGKSLIEIWDKLEN